MHCMHFIHWSIVLAFVTFSVVVLYRLFQCFSICNFSVVVLYRPFIVLVFVTLFFVFCTLHLLFVVVFL